MPAEIHVKHKDHEASLCGKHMYDPPFHKYGILLWTYRITDQDKWLEQPNCEECLLLAFAEPDTVAYCEAHG